MKSINILATGGHAKVIFSLVKSLGYQSVDFFDDNITNANFPIKNTINSEINGNSIIAIGNNFIRRKISKKITLANWSTLIHPSAIIAEDVKIGEGSVVMAGSIIQTGSIIGKHCIINTGACVDHDCLIGDFVHIAPNCGLAGGVSVGEGAFIGIGSSLIPNIVIGKWSTIGAGSIVINDQPDFCTSVGVPAKPIKFKNEQK